LSFYARLTRHIAFGRFGRLVALTARLAWLAAIGLTSTASYAGSAFLTWTEPTQNTDGSPLTNLASYRVYYGCSSSGTYPNSRLIPAPASSYVLDGLPDVGRCYFALTAVNSTAVESVRSNEASKFMGTLAAPGEPGIAITWAESPVVSGINFRITAGWVVDPPGTTYATPLDSYPTTRAGLTFGWVSGSPDGRDRAGTDPRLSGIAHNITPGTAPRFDMDLGAPGRYRVCVAAGDVAYENWSFFTIFDGPTAVYAQPQVRTLAGQFLDMTGTVRANWVTESQCRELDFATSKLGVTINGPAGGSASVLAHLSFARVN
jgi:hypothetical protein